MKLIAISVTLAVVATLGAAGRAAAWGKVGHEYANSAAVDTLPPDTSLAKFFAANRAFLVAHASDPDLWRDTDAAEAPHHFIDMDAYGTPSAFALTNLPTDRTDADKKFGHGFVEKQGTVDWTITAWTQSLSDAMKRGDTDAILADAAVLGHYVADAHVPFHSALNYDGQVSAQRGIHARFESRMVEETVKLTDLTPEPAQSLDNVLGSARAWSGQSLDLTPTILAADVQARILADVDKKPAAGPMPAGDSGSGHRPLPRDGSPAPAYYDNNPVYWKAFESACRPIALARLNAAATHLGDVWLTAWTLAGKPDLSRVKAPTPNTPVPVPDPGAAAR